MRNTATVSLPTKPISEVIFTAPQKPHFLRVEETADRFVSGEGRAEENGKDDSDASEVFNPPVTVGEPRAWLPRAHAKRDPQGDCCRGVACVVDGICEKCDASGIVGDNGLQERCQQESRLMTT